MDRAAADSFQDWALWQKAHEFVLAVYRHSDYFPPKEIYGLTLQFRRAAITIAASIAEGHGKKSNAEKAGFLYVAKDSLESCRYYLILAKDLGYGDNPELMPLLEEINKMLMKCIMLLMALSKGSDN
jgi:four helix bundle protein